MPDFNDLADRLLTDMSRADWRDADLIRAAGNRRGRVQLAVNVAAVAVVAVVAVLLLANAALPHGGATAASPPSSRPAASQPPSPSGPPAGPTRQGTIPSGALLTPADLWPVFAGLASQYAQPYSPNPFAGCGPDDAPAPAP